MSGPAAGAGAPGAQRAASAPLAVAECGRCGCVIFPPRPLCPRCGARRWRRRAAGGGVLEEVTEARGGRVGSVRTGAGPVVVCRVAAGIEPGARVALSVRERGGEAADGVLLEAAPEAAG